MIPHMELKGARGSVMKHIFSLLTVAYILGLFIGCSEEVSVELKKPVTLNMWHNYGGQMKNLMDELIDEFNNTVGTQKGIMINVTSISSSSALHEKLVSSANGDPGVPSLPDITTAYPKTALILAQEGLLMNLETQFSDNELKQYIPRFLEEGRLHDGKLYLLPVAKSTEVLFLNKTIFDRFANETGVTYDELGTFEGIIRVADKYYEWTDNQTPDQPNDGKTFYMLDSLFNMAQVGFAQLGDEFIKDGALNLSSPVFKRIWDSCYIPSVLGRVVLFDGYSSDLFKTGDVICSTGSTAGVLFYPDQVTYADNSKEDVEYVILPYPIFEGGAKVAIQRGGGMCVIKSTKEKEHAAAVFLKWFTEPAQNLRFTASSGYFPVTEKAFHDVMEKEIESLPDNNIKKLLSTAVMMQKEYDFFIPPLVDDFDNIQKQYETRLKEAVLKAKAELESCSEKQKRDMVYKEVLKNGLEEFLKQ